MTSLLSQTFQTVLCDWNGTLLNDAPFTHAIHSAMLQARELHSPNFLEFQEMHCQPHPLMYEKLGYDLEKEAFGVLSSEWRASYLTGLSAVRLHSDVIESLRTLRGYGAELHILSALPQEALLESVRDRGISPFFRSIKGTSPRDQEGKIQAGRELIKEHSINPRSTLLVGDSLDDVRTAEELGVTCALVSRGYDSEKKLSDSGFAVFPDLSFLKNVRVSALEIASS